MRALVLGWLNDNLGVAMVSVFLSFGVLWVAIKSSRRSR